MLRLQGSKENGGRKKLLMPVLGSSSHPPINQTTREGEEKRGNDPVLVLQLLGSRTRVARSAQ